MEIFLIAVKYQGYCWLENVRGHFVENVQVESLSPISLHYKTGPLFQNKGAILEKGDFAHGPLPKLSLKYLLVILLISSTV